MDATRYTHGHEAAVLASHAQRTAENSAHYLLPVLTAGLSVLDVGCGPGTITLDLAEHVSPGTVVGLDAVEEPLTAARQTADQRGDRHTEFQVGSVVDLPFDADSFDVVHAHQVLQHLTDPVRALTEMARVCRPGGWVAARDADYAAMAWHPQLPELEEWRGLYRAMARANGAEPDAGRRMRSWAQSADLTDVRFTASVWNYADAQTCHWWGHSQADRVLGAVFAAQSAEHGVSSADRERLAQGWRRWADAPDAWFAILHGELLARPGSAPQPGPA